MTRTQNVKRNLVYNVVKFASQLVLQFVLRTVLIYFMGNEYIGLNGLFTNIFNFLNLAELGIGSAIVFSMYKPIAENDIEKVKALQNLYKKFYLIIALIVLLIGGILTPFINVFISGEVTVNINIYILFVMYLFNAFIGYFSAHKRSLLFAYQRNDVENKIRTICLFAMTILQILVILIFKNYYLFFAVNIAFTLIECILVHVWANKLLPEINGKGGQIDSATKKEITKNVAALSLHKIGGAVVFSTDNILVSSFFGVIVLGAYSNYALIVSSLNSFIALITNAFTGSVGNLIASSDVEYTYKKFKQINFMLSYISAFCTICLVCLFQPFIEMWTGGGEYLLNFSTMLIISLSFYLTKMRSGVIMFKDCAGLYWQDRWKPVVEAVVNLGVSILLAYFIGINGIFIGTIISTIVAPIWVEPYVLFKKFFKKGLWQYFKYFFRDVLIMVVCGAICFGVCYFIPDGSIWWLILKFAVCIIFSNVLLVLAYFSTKEFKEWVALFKEMVKGKRMAKQVKQEEILQRETCEENILKAQKIEEVKQNEELQPEVEQLKNEENAESGEN